MADNIGNPTYGTGFVEIDNPGSQEYGKVGIEYHYWRDDNAYWHYSYQLLNDYHGTADNSDDYHFSWDQGGGDPDVYDLVNKFSLNLKSSFDGMFWHGPDDLYLLDTSAGSSAGGDPWGSSADLFNAGVDWTVSLGGGTPLQIEPARYLWKKVGGTWQWVKYSDGDTSTDDSSSQYFQIASSWAPGLVKASVVAGFSMTAYSNDGAGYTDYVMAPVVVPEPASILMLGFSVWYMFGYRHRKS